MTTLEQVKNALGIKGEYQDDTIKEYFDEVVDFLKESGVPSAKMTTGLVARGVSDLWNYGGERGVLSPYFLQRATQIYY